MNRSLFDEYEKMFTAQKQSLVSLNYLTECIDRINKLVPEIAQGKSVPVEMQVSSIELFHKLIDAIKCNPEFGTALQKFCFEQNIEIGKQHQIGIDNLTAKKFGV